jgi:phage terminase large subunit
MQPITITYRPRGAAYDLFSCRDREVMQEGPAGTGKTTASLMKMHIALLKYPASRWLILRKTHASLTATALVTYNEKVLHPLDGVRFFGGSGNRPSEYRYPNKAVAVVGGMDRPEKHMSSDYDGIYVPEATDLTLNDWESLTTRLRNNVMPYQQIIGDCNPTYPEHWANKRMQAGKTTRLISRHEDNPMLYDEAGNVTPNGAAYMAALDALTGVRYLRLRKGIWAAAEGTVYQDAWDSATNLIDRFPIPREWPRFLSVDFGFTRAFVCQFWAQDPDGRIYLYREIYKTKTLVEDHAKKIIEVAGWNRDGGDPLPYAIIRDHDAEDGATLERHLHQAGIHIMTTRAIKNVSAGINASAARMRKAGDGKPRLYILRDSLVEIDRELQSANLPYCTLHEFDSYVWNEKKDAPIKEADHGMDCLRYVCMHLEAPRNVETVKSLYR